MISLKMNDLEDCLYCWSDKFGVFLDRNEFVMLNFNV